ncbi:MAG: hypothetical protein GKR99_10235 [Rhodobacteraceae bacterium]|nr:hypothetical protein [Paracoccaceae bacterium]
MKRILAFGVFFLAAVAAADARAQSSNDDTVEAPAPAAVDTPNATIAFDASILSEPERRTLQAALTFSGDYQGAVNGDWDAASQSALVAYAARTRDGAVPGPENLHTILAALEDERRANSWETVHFDGAGHSHLMPFALIEPVEEASEIDFESVDGAFGFSVRFGPMDRMTSIHARLASRHVGEGPAFRRSTPDQVVTAIDTATGRHVFARSDKGDAGWVTSIISAEPVHRARLSLMAASFARGEPPIIRVDPQGRLAALIAPDEPSEADIAAEAAKGPTTANAARGATPSGIGTGFYVNSTDILTAAHVVADCGRVSPASGAPLRVTVMNEALDLALLASGAPSPSWLVLGGLPDARLGERVFALGFPYAGILSSRLTVTGGNVSALDGILPDESRLMISAPIQPGNSGGPVLNKRGEVLGVVVSRLDELTVLGATGTLPQNMNFAVPPDAMMGFLEDADVLFPARRAAPFLVEDGLPEGVEDAIVPIECH